MKELIINSEDTIYDIADLFKNFSDSSRIKILLAILDSEKSVSEIIKIVNMSQSAVSHQLSILKSSKLIKNKKVGKTVYYSLADKHVLNILLQGKEHAEE